MGRPTKDRRSSCHTSVNQFLTSDVEPPRYRHNSPDVRRVRPASPCRSTDASPLEAFRLLAIYNIYPTELAILAPSCNVVHITRAIAMTPAPHFEALLESVEALSVEEQEILIDLVRRRLVERRRAEIAANIAKAQAEYQAGQMCRGTVDELMAKLNE